MWAAEGALMSLDRVDRSRQLGAGAAGYQYMAARVDLCRQQGSYARRPGRMDTDGTDCTDEGGGASSTGSMANPPFDPAHLQATPDGLSAGNSTPSLTLQDCFGCNVFANRDRPATSGSGYTAGDAGACLVFGR